jgi:hypothetical protein
MSIEYTALSVQLFTEGPDGWQTIFGDGFTGVEDTDKAKIASVIASFDSWLAANPSGDDAQFNWRLFEFCIMNDDKARAATALQAAVDKGKTFDDGALEASRAKIA